MSSPVAELVSDLPTLVFELLHSCNTIIDESVRHRSWIDKTLKPLSLGDTLSVRLNRLVRLLDAVSARLNPLVLRRYLIMSL